MRNITVLLFLLQLLILFIWTRRNIALVFSFCLLFHHLLLKILSMSHFLLFNFLHKKSRGTSSSSFLYPRIKLKHPMLLHFPTSRGYPIPTYFLQKYTLEDSQERHNLSEKTRSLQLPRLQ